MDSESRFCLRRSWIVLHLAAPTGLPGDSGFVTAVLKNKWIVLPLVITATVLLMRFLSPTAVKGNLKRQYKIFKNKHTWVMTVIYTMTFGSFIGFSAAVALSIKFVFGFQHILVDGVMTHDTLNPDGPSALMFAWVGPFIGALIRPVGGKIADKMGGAKVTQIVAIVMIISSLVVAWFLKGAFSSPTPQQYWWPFFILLVVLFATTGVGNGSTFRTIAMVFDQEQAGPVLGWTSAVALMAPSSFPRSLVNRWL